MSFLKPIFAGLLMCVLTPIVHAQTVEDSYDPFETGIIKYDEGGSVRGGGGDPTETEIKKLRDQLGQFLYTRSAKKLDFKDRLTWDVYVNGTKNHKPYGMKEVLSQGAVIVSVIHEKDQDRNDELKNTYVGDDKKVCKGVYLAKKDRLSHLICEIEGFGKVGTNNSDRAKKLFELIHHEYAALAGIEHNLVPDSDYFLSEQIGKLVSYSYLKGELYFELPINPNETFGHMLSYLPIKAKGKKFKMGSPENEYGRYPNETQREVVLKEDFEMLESSVTQDMFYRVMEFNPSVYHEYENCPRMWDPARGGTCVNNPVESVRFSDICGEVKPEQTNPYDCGKTDSFIKRLNDIGDGCVYRLPTEEEWEFAARAGITTAYPNGEVPNSTLIFDAWNDEARKLAVNAGVNEDPGDINMNLGTTHEVLFRFRNAFGLADMIGNVAQWTFTSDLEGNRIARGSGFGFALRDARFARRYKVPATLAKSKSLGFRPVRVCK